jgi:bifunctional oligoribonuclease and PAP phosphatase NrnA
VSELSVNADLQAIADRIAAAQTILIATHARPDGDGLGSMVALGHLAKKAGKTVRMVSEDVPLRYQFLFPDQTPAGISRFATLAGQADEVLLLDTSTPGQLEPITEQFRAVHDKTLVLDHHAVGGDIGAIQWVDEHAAAAGIMVAELVELLGWELDAVAAEALLTAIVSDTGWLQYANTDGRCLRLAGKLVDAGVRTDKLYHELFQNARLERLKLLARVLDSLELYCEGRLAVMTVVGEDFAATGAKPGEMENLINASLEIGTVETAIILVENEENIRVSFRSRDLLDVAAIAKQFGGGGHRRAAGARVFDSMDVVKDKLIHICQRAFAQLGRKK